MIQDPLGDNRQEFPLTLYVVAGTQAERSNANNVIVMKMSNLKKTKEDDDKEESESESEEEMEDEKPELETAMMKHNGGVNRIRVQSHIKSLKVNNKSNLKWITNNKSNF